MTYGYEIEGTLKGTLIEEYSVYSYTKHDVFKQPKLTLKPFSYHIEAKIDARGNQAI
jgi:hypothetical protein